MIDFGLEPCPLCAGEAQVAQLVQGPEELRAVIKCTECGLTLTWETEIKVGISRTGKRTVAKAGLDPIEAWNRRAICKNCGERLHSYQVGNLPNCNDCGAAKTCEYIPKPGDWTRINCPLWRDKEEKQ